MTPEYGILTFYRSEFVRLKIEARRGGVALQHCAWMIEECLTMLTVPTQDREVFFKVNRWIGFVQGVLWKEGIYTVDQLREHVTIAKGVSNAAV